MNSAEILRHEIPKVQKDCQNNARDFINKLSSWMDESHRQMSDIISYHSRTIDKDFNNLAEEFSDLKAQVSVLRKEREVLLKSIDNLNHEIGQMNAKVLLAEPEQDSQDPGASDEDIPCVKEEFAEPPWTHTETSDEAKSTGKEDILDTCVQQQTTEYPMDDQSLLNKSTVNWLDNADDNDRVHSQMEKSHMRQEGNEESNQAQQQFQNKNISQGRGTKFKCPKCPLETSWKTALTRHIKSVHDNIRNHVCGECGYSASTKCTLRDHMDGIHKKIKKHVCEMCGFAATQKSNIRSHKKNVHSLGSQKTDERFECEECNYITNGLKNFRRHMDKIHKLRTLAYGTEPSRLI